MIEPGRASFPTGVSPKTLLGAASRIGAAPFVLLAAFLVPLPVEGGRSLLGLPDLCPFRNLTGLPCPGCGMTRSLVCFAHGHIADAFRFHPLGPIVFAGLIVATIVRLPLPPRLLAPLRTITSDRAKTIAGLALIAALLIVEAARLMGYLPAPP